MVLAESLEKGKNLKPRELLIYDLRMRSSSG
uniref:Uncharacterized protein n=1 Tax=Rhizophora mucronata TaxID=61149 RepID=A0A2P2PVU7_RHIMU